MDRRTVTAEEYFADVRQERQAQNRNDKGSGESLARRHLCGPQEAKDIRRDARVVLLGAQVAHQRAEQDSIVETEAATLLRSDGEWVRQCGVI